jgi:hypothetical protein
VEVLSGVQINFLLPISGTGDLNCRFRTGADLASLSKFAKFDG